MSASRLTKAALKIPKRIERGPTDILRALASTVKFVPNEPDSLLHDDPYLLPKRPAERTIFSLSYISGKNTAKFLLNKHPEQFFRDDSEPKVEDFLPPEEFRMDMDLTQDDLVWCIDNHDVINGSIAYQVLQDKGIKIDKEVLLNFFELVCFTNEEKLSSEIEIMKNYFVRDMDRQLVNYTWKNNGLASGIFNEIKEEIDPSRVYTTMIAGLSRFNEHEAARQVFEDFKEAHPNEGLYPEAYDGLLNSVRNLNSSVATAHEAVEVIVQHMRDHFVKPNLRIFNTILNIYRSYNCDEQTAERALMLINDMRAMGIEPSLTTYDQLIHILQKIRYGRVHADKIQELINYISSDDKVLEVRDERDVFFLRNAMRLFSNNPNLRLANKLHKIYLKKPTLFSSNSIRQQFLDIYFRLLITMDKLETTMDFYDTYVPIMYRPSLEAYDALAEALDLYQADEAIVKRIGSDILEYRVADKIKNDAIFRKSPEYVKGLEEQLEARTSRR